MTHLLHHVLTRSAARVPDKEALRFEGVGLPYWQLEALTNQVARALRDAGVRRGDRVGVYVHKSPAAVIGVFGAMKAGAIYVPLDPNAPAKRLAYITRNCEIKALITSGYVTGLVDLLREHTPVKTVLLMDDREPAGLPESLRAVRWPRQNSRAAHPCLPPERLRRT